MYCVSRTWSKEEPHYEFDLELREKLAAARRKAAEAERGGGEGEGEGEGRLWTSASSEPRLDSRVNGITGTSTGGHISENGRQALVMYTSTSHSMFTAYGLLHSRELSVKDRSKWKRAWPKKCELGKYSHAHCTFEL